jgi:predicted DNA-binding transcriptional regulator AlpA
MPSRAKSAIATRLPIRRGLDECEAALYLSLSPTFFRKLVASGSMPKPRRIGSRRVWDIDELDLAFKALPRDDEGTEIHDTKISSSWTDFK